MQKRGGEGGRHTSISTAGSVRRAVMREMSMRRCSFRRSGSRPHPVTTRGATSRSPCTITHTSVPYSGCHAASPSALHRDAHFIHQSRVRTPGEACCHHMGYYHMAHYHHMGCHAVFPLSESPDLVFIWLPM